MLLKQVSQRTALLLGVCLLPLLLGACSPFPAEDETVCAQPPVASPSPADDAGESLAELPPVPAGEPKRKAFLPLRLDPRPNESRTIRAAYRRDEPGTRPTPREQREARAMVQAESDLLAKGGIPMYRSDGSASNPSGVKYVSSPGALTFDFVASPHLNSIDELPHALRLVVYHLSDRAGLDRLAEHGDGILKLLEGEYFDESVKSVRTHHVQPDSSGRLFLDRPEGGRYVAVVAGYDRPHAGTSVFVSEYGLGQWKTPGESIIHNATLMFSPLPLHLQAMLGESGMAVRDTGRIYSNMKRVTSLTRQQTRHLAANGYPFPGSR